MGITPGGTMNFNTVARMNRAGSFNIATDHLLSLSYLDLSTLALDSVTVSQGVLDMFPKIDVTINGYYALTTTSDQYAYYTTTDHLGVTQAIFIGVIPTSGVEFNPADNKTRLSGYGLGFYQTQQILPDQFLHNYASQNPAITVRGLIGADEWAGLGGINPYNIMPVVAWGDTLNTKVFDFSRTDIIKAAIQQITDYTRHVYLVQSFLVSGNPVNRAYFVHEDDIDIYLDLPAPVTITAPSAYCDTGVTCDWKGEEAYNQILVIGRDPVGNTFSGIYSSPDVIQGNIPPRTYIENSGSWTTQAQVTARALELYGFYGTAASVYSATLSDRTDLRLLQKIKFSGYTGISSDWMRITNIQYKIGPEVEKSVTIQFTSDAKFSNMRRMYRSMLPDPVSEMQSVFNDSMSNVPGNDVGTVTTLNGDGTALITLEDGRQVTSRVF